MKSRKTLTPNWDISLLNQLGVTIHRVEVDSRRLFPGDIFLAYPGSVTDGRNFIPVALQAGTAAILWDPVGNFIWQPTWSVPNLAVPYLREHAGVIASHVYQYPSQRMNVIGITGTNGKTSIAHGLAQAFSLLGHKAALIGTVGSGFYGALTEVAHTTPDPVILQQKLFEYYRQEARVVTVEVSSHALEQGRVNGVHFSTALFTNLTRDHLDYHGTMEAYGAAKARLFYWEGLKHAIVNVDDPFGARLAAGIDNQVETIRYGSQSGDVRALSLQTSLEGLRLTTATPWGKAEICSPLLGRFNALNLLACLATLCVNGVSLSDAAHILSQIQPAYGRMQRMGGGNEPLVIIDYSHTPDALEKALVTAAELCGEPHRLYCVFGCGGERDVGKRPLMGRIAQRIADTVVVTSDNPRTEDPQAIINDILAGMRLPVQCEVDRELAIHWAITQAQKNDIVLIAGKGHEEYQDVSGIKRSFSDLKVAEQALIEWRKVHHVDA